MAEAKKTALVVDDEPDIIGIVKTILEGEGFEVTGANDGLEVFPLLEKQIPDVLIIDRMMPGMNGLEVVRRLKASAKTSAIPVVMLTSMGKFDDVSEGYTQGADGYITKPFTKSQIVNGVKLVLASRPELKAADVQLHAAAFLRACAKLSARTAELAARFAAQEGLSPGAWAYRGLEARLTTDQEQKDVLKITPEWRCRFHGWGVDFHHSKTGEQADLAIGPGGRCDSFDEGRVQAFVQNQARRKADFVDLDAVIENHSDAARLLIDYLSRQGWIEPAAAQGEVTKKELDAQLGDRWVVSQKGRKMLQQI